MDVVRFENGISHPRFRVEECYVMPSHNYTGASLITRYDAECVGRLEWFNSSKEVVSYWELSTGCTSSDMDYAMKQCIQDILDHNYKLTVRICDKEMDLELGKKIYYDFSNLREPWKSLFESLFLNGNFQMHQDRFDALPRKIISSH